MSPLFDRLKSKKKDDNRKKWKVSNGNHRLFFYEKLYDRSNIKL